MVRTPATKHQHPNGEPAFRSVDGCPRCEGIKAEKAAKEAGMTQDIAELRAAQPTEPVGLEGIIDPTPLEGEGTDDDELPELPPGAEDYAKRRDGTMLALYPDGSTAAWDGEMWLPSVATIPLTGPQHVQAPPETDAQMRASIMGQTLAAPAPLTTAPALLPQARQKVRVTEFAVQNKEVQKFVVPNPARPDRPETFYTYGGERYAGMIGQYVAGRVGRRMEYTLYPTQEEVDMARNHLIRQQELEQRARNRNRNPNATLPETVLR